MRKFVTVVLTTSLLGVTSASAQETFHWPAPAAASGPTARSYFPMGTPVVFRTRTEVNSKQAKPGDRVYLEVAESITYRGQIVVPIGAPAVAEVVRSEKNGHFGKKGKVEVRLLSMETPHGPVRLSGQAGDDGKGAGVWSIGGTALVAWPMAFIHGTSGYIRHGTAVTGYLAEPLSFVQAPASPAVAVVQPDNRALPARFDPSVFGGNGSGTANR